MRRMTVFYIVLASTALFIVYYLSTNQPSETVVFDRQPAQQMEQKTKRKEQRNEADKKEETKIYIDIKGAVKNPGVYAMTKGSRVLDAVTVAGGALKNADMNRVNLAQRVADEMVVFIPSIGKNIPDFTGISTGGKNNDNVVNINTADSRQLESLPGIGPAKAAEIISYRKNHGPFKTVNALQNVNGIGPKSIESLKGRIRVK